MKKLFFYMGAFIIALTACNTERSDNYKTESTVENQLSNQNVNRLSNFSDVIAIGNKEFVPQEDHSVAYYLDGEYQHDIILENPDIEIINDFDTTGEIIVINNTSLLEESLTIKNIRNLDDHLLLDLELSTGTTIQDVKIYNVSKKGGPSWIGPVIRAVVQIAIAAIFDSNDDGSISHSECTKALASINCGGGQNPYMNYTSGNWFTAPRCEVGCR